VRAEQKKFKQSAFDVYEKRKFETQMRTIREIDNEFKSIAMMFEAMRVFDLSYREIASELLIGEFTVEMLIRKITKLTEL